MRRLSRGERTVNWRCFPGLSVPSGNHYSSPTLHRSEKYSVLLALIYIHYTCTFIQIFLCCIVNACVWFHLKPGTFCVVTWEGVFDSVYILLFSHATLDVSVDTPPHPHPSEKRRYVPKSAYTLSDLFWISALNKYNVLSYIKRIQRKLWLHDHKLITYSGQNCEFVHIPLPC